MERIGVYVCECGPNIKEALDIDAVVRFAGSLQDVVLATPFSLLCSAEGKALIATEIKTHNLSRVVIAAYSPKAHETAFREVLKIAGLNPFLMQVANIREQCAWVVKDKAAATQKAKAIIKAAVFRVVCHEPLEIKTIECRPEVLVVGAGVAGISAALTLSQKNRMVYVVEKAPCSGGKAARYEDLFPGMGCAACVLDPLLDEALHDEHIEFLTFSEIQEVLGYYGNFTVKVKRNARFVDPSTCLGCEMCFEVCPVKVKNEFNEGLNERKAIYIPYAGALPNVAVIDKMHCLRFKEKECNACREACPFGSIDYEDTDRVEALNVGAIVLATGFDLFDPVKAPQYGYPTIENVYTGLEFERLLNSTGPTGGEIVLKNGQPPEKIALIHCVGSRTARYNEHCSGVCCLYSMKFAHQTRQKLPNALIRVFHSDFCLPGKVSQGFFNRVSEADNVEFYHMQKPDAVQIISTNKDILIQYTDVLGNSNTKDADLVVLAAAMEGAKDACRLADIFDIPQDRDRFFMEENATLASVSTVREGVYIAGCAQGPKDIQSSVAQGQAAAGRILSRLVPGEKLEIAAITAEVDAERCSGCKICLDVCAYRAITGDERVKQARVNELLCRGCGACAAVCPSGAITSKHFTDEQICAEIKALAGEKVTFQ